MHYSSDTNYKNPISLDCNCLIIVIISRHEASFKEIPNDLKEIYHQRLWSRAGEKTRAANKNLVEASCRRCVNQHFCTKDDSHFTESGPSVKCFNKLELLFLRRALLSDFEIFCLNKHCTFDLCASHVED